MRTVLRSLPRITLGFSLVMGVRRATGFPLFEMTTSSPPAFGNGNLRPLIKKSSYSGNEYSFGCKVPSQLAREGGSHAATQPSEVLWVGQRRNAAHWKRPGGESFADFHGNLPHALRCG